MPKPEAVSQTADSKPQFVFILCLVAVGVGNITFPSSVPLFSQIYLPACLAVLSVLIFLNLRRVGKQISYPPLIVMAFVSFLPGFLITSLNSYGKTKILAFAIALLLVISPSVLRSPAASIQLLMKLILVLSSATSILLLLVGEPDTAGRLTLWGLNPIGTGRITGIGVVIAGSLLVTRWSGIKSVWLLFPSAILCFIATVQTGSRGPLLAILVSLIALIVVAGVSRTLFQRILALVILGVVGSLGFSSSMASDSRIFSGDVNGRDLLFSAALNAIRDHPIGIGWGNFYQELPSFSGAAAYTLYPHNILLEIGAEGGWLALGAFVILLVFSVKNILASSRAGSQAAAIVLAILIFTILNALFSSDVVGNRLLWLAIGLSLVALPSKPNSSFTGIAPVATQRRGLERHGAE